MSAGLDAWLRGVGAADAPSLASALARLLAAHAAPLRFQAGETLRAGQVHRARFRPVSDNASESSRALVIKRLSLDRAHREQRAVRHWLPGIGLGAHGAPLLAVAAAPDAGSVWHVYEDLGDETLARIVSERGEAREETLRAALALVAALHVRFASHPLLADCRLAGIDLGAGFFAASLTDALRSLVALRRLPSLPREQRPLLDRLLERLGSLAAERDARTREVVALGWPETLQHGDLWLANFMRAPGAGRPHLCLIDWDRAGIGPALYDLSTFLRQLPAADRAGPLAVYQERVARAGWPWPDPALFERVAETCELGRFASCLLWRTLPVLESCGEAGSPPAWLFDDLVEMERWFAERTPLSSDFVGASAA